MPTYLYKREDSTTFEITQKISEEALKTCPETGQAVKRVITGGGGVVYKGSGWYVTDYKNGSGSSASGNDREQDSGAGRDGADRDSSGPGSSAHGNNKGNGTTAPSDKSGRTSGNGPASNGASVNQQAGAGSENTGSHSPESNTSK